MQESSSPPRRRFWVVVAAMFTVGFVTIYAFDVATLTKHANALTTLSSSSSKSSLDVSEGASEDWKTLYENLLHSLGEEKKARANSFTAVDDVGNDIVGDKEATTTTTTRSPNEANTASAVATATATTKAGAITSSSSFLVTNYFILYI